MADTTPQAALDTVAAAEDRGKALAELTKNDALMVGFGDWFSGDPVGFSTAVAQIAQVKPRLSPRIVESFYRAVESVSLGVGRKVFTGGAHFGIGLSTLNAKSTGNITATLLSVTDTYSLLGAAAPGGSPTDEDSTGYTAPSSSSESVTNADGTTTSNTIDTTTYLASLPDSRTESITPSGATIDGLWQVRGAFFNVRTGPWIRWQPSDRFSLRLSAGGSMNFVGVKMRHDETLDLEDLSTELTQQIESDSENMAVPGYFGGIDAEWWFSETTGFFGSASYEKATKDKSLTYEGRTAELEMSSGLGLRAGLTVKF